MSTTLTLAHAATPSGAPARWARWDPNLPDAVGVSHEDGTFSYSPSGGRSMRLQLFRSQLGDTAAGRRNELGLVPPAAVHAPWSLWAFVPGAPGRLLICHRHSPHLLTTAISLQLLPDGTPDAAHGSSQQPRSHVIASSGVQELNELQGESSLTALAVSSCGSFGATGSLDGTVCFWRILAGAASGSAPAHAHSCVHEAAHAAPVTALGMLTGQVHAAGVQTALCASGAADQSVTIFDLHARTRLVSLLTPCAAPVTSLHLELIPPHAPAAPAEQPAEPSVLVLLGASDGGVQAWSLCSGSEAELKATWLHSEEAPILAFGLSGNGAAVLSVAESGSGGDGGRGGSGGADPARGEVEVHSSRDWTFIGRRSVCTAAQGSGEPTHGGADPIVSADFSRGDELRGNGERLLLARASGVVHRWDVSQPAHPGPPLSTPQLPSSQPPHPSLGFLAPLPRPANSVRQSAASAASPSPACLEPPHAPPHSTAHAPPSANGARPPAAMTDNLISLDANSGHCGGRPGSSLVGSTAASRRAGPRPRPPPLRPTPPPALAPYLPETRVAERLPPRPASPPPAPHRHYDRPERVRALLAPPPEGPPASLLAAPSVLSSAILQRQLAAADAEFAQAEAAAFADAVRRRATREASAVLESPPEQATRYVALPSLEAAPAAAHRPVARRAEPRWLAAQALQPSLAELHTAEREPQIVDTGSEACTPDFLSCLAGCPSQDETAAGAAAGGWPEGLWAKVRLGHQRPLVH